MDSTTSQAMLDPIDYEALLLLNARYCEALDARESARFGDLWGSEAAYLLPGRGEFRGPQGIQEALALMADAWRHTVHLSGNLMIESADGDRVCARSSVIAICEDHRGVVTLLAGAYRDTYLRRDGEWRFWSREFEREHQRKPGRNSGVTRHIGMGLLVSRRMAPSARCP